MQTDILGKGSEVGRRLGEGWARAGRVFVRGAGHQGVKAGFRVGRNISISPWAKATLKHNQSKAKAYLKQS